ncbi:hypothetical protein C8F04DRAFT_984870, partial [Mycena alexandri]
WLFEPRRSSKVQRWSGTNEYPPWDHSKLGSTLNTFTHYAYIVSHESTVFCDLLFFCRSSGVGDHEKTGIQTFLKKHNCVQHCINLQLKQDGFESSTTNQEDSADDN